MKTLIALAFVFTFLSPNLLSQTGDTQMPMAGGAETQLTDLEKQGITAAKGGDPSFMQSHLADDYMGISAMGKMMDKPTSIDYLKSGKTKYEKLDIVDRKVTQYGPNAAVVRGTVMLKGMVAGQPVDGTYAFSRTWLQRDGKWQVISFQSTKVQ